MPAGQSEDRIRTMEENPRTLDAADASTWVRQDGASRRSAPHRIPR